MLGIETVAVLFPVLVGRNVIVKVVLLPGIIVLLVELVLVLNSEEFCPFISRIGDPWRYKVDIPIFSTVKEIAALEEFTVTLPKS